MYKLLLMIGLLGRINVLYSQIIGEYKIIEQSHIYKHYLMLELINANSDTLLALSPCHNNCDTNLTGQVIREDNTYKLVLLKLNAQKKLNFETKSKFAPGQIGFIFGAYYLEFGDFGDLDIYLVLNTQCDVVLPVDSEPDEK